MELGGPAVSALRRAIAEVMLVSHWMDDQKIIISIFSVSLVPAAFAVASTHQPTLGPRGRLWPVLLMYNP
jgi:hypothetical protein